MIEPLKKNTLQIQVFLNKEINFDRMKDHIQEIQHNLFFGNKYINIQNIQDFFFLKEKPNKKTFLCIVTTE